MKPDHVAFNGQATAAPPPGLAESIRALLGDLRGSLAARVEIAQIEARQSLGLVARSFAAACAAVLLALTAWWAVCAALVLLAVDAGAPRLGALFSVAAGNVALALWAANYARKRMTSIGMPYTRRVFLDPAEGTAEIHREQVDAAVQ